MVTRQEQAAARRKKYHDDRRAAATTDLGRLWATCSWLLSEARAAGRVAEVTAAVLDLVKRVREDKDLPAALPAAAHPNTRTRAEGKRAAA